MASAGDPKYWGPLHEAGSQPKNLATWRTRHGPATLFWTKDGVVRISDVLMPDGRRADVQMGLGPGATCRTRNADRNGFTHGSPIFSRDDVEFIPLVRNPTSVPRDAVVEALALMRQAADLTRLANASAAHACALYTHIQNRRLTHIGGMKVDFGTRTAGSLVAALRNRGEGEIDFTMMKDEDYDAGLPLLPEITAALTQAGFTVADL
jgi:hypothetical protein